MTYKKQFRIQIILAMISMVISALLYILAEISLNNPHLILIAFAMLTFSSIAAITFILFDDLEEIKYILEGNFK